MDCLTSHQKIGGFSDCPNQSEIILHRTTTPCSAISTSRPFAILDPQRPCMATQDRQPLDPVSPKPGSPIQPHDTVTLKYHSAPGGGRKGNTDHLILCWIVAVRLSKDRQFSHITSCLFKYHFAHNLPISDLRKEQSNMVLQTSPRVQTSSPFALH